MNWMTSAKKRVYKPKRQREHQQRLSAHNKVHEITKTVEVQSLHAKSTNKQRAPSNSIIDVNLIRNLCRERAPQPLATHLDHPEFPHRRTSISSYNPLDELVHSPLSRKNQLEDDVQSAIDSFRPPQETEESIHSSPSILFIDNGRIMNEAQHTSSGGEKIFRLDLKEEDIFQENAIKQRTLPPPISEKEPSNRRKSPSRPLNLSHLDQIPQTWDLFEGQYETEKKDLLQVESKTLKMSNLKKRTIDNLYLHNSKTGMIDVDDEFNVCDFIN